MHNKQRKKIIETLKCKNVYIIKRIANDLDKFTLLSVMQCDVLSTFSAMQSLMNLNDSMNLLKNSMNLDHIASHTEVNYHETEL